MVCRIIIADAAVRDAYAHFYVYTTALHNAAIKLGYEVRCAVSSACNDVAEEFGGERILNFPAWGNRHLSNFTYAGNWANCSTISFAGYSNLNKLDLKSDDLIIFHSAQPHEIYGIGIWYASLAENARPFVSIGVHTPAELYADSSDYDLVKVLYGKSLRLFSDYILAKKAEFTATNSKLAKYMSDLLGGPVRVSSVIIETRDFLARSKTRRSREEFIYSGSSPEKGIQQVYDFCQIFRTSPICNVDIIIHVANVNIAHQFRSALGSIHHIAIREGSLSREDYVDLFMGAGAVMLPYNASDYACRISGMMHEALCLGTPVIVPAQTAMSEQLVAAGLPGVILSGSTGADLYEAVVTLQSEIDVRTTIAGARAGKFSENLKAEKYLQDIFKNLDL